MSFGFHVGQLNSSSSASYKCFERRALETKVYLALVVDKHKLARACMNAVPCVIEL